MPPTAPDHRMSAFCRVMAIALGVLLLHAPTAAHAADTVPTPVTELESHPISPPDTSSPRATLESFLLVMREAERLWIGTRTALAGRPGSPPTDQERRAFRIAGILLDKAAEAFDFSEVPESARAYDRLATVLRFKEILDRIEVPEPSAIPGAPAGSFLDSRRQGDLPESWTIPYTDLTIVRQTGGDQNGRFLFSAASVARIERDYHVIADLPERGGGGIDLYQYYRRSPGGLMPPRWFALIENGPAWLQAEHNGQPIWKWIARFLAVTVFAGIPILLHRWLRGRPAPTSPGRRGLRTLYLPAVIVGCVYSLRYVMQEQVNLTGSWTVGMTVVTEAIIWSVAAWGVYQLVNILSAWLLTNPKLPRDALDASLLRTGCRILGIALGLLVLGYGATQIGIPVYGVVAGLGIGGLAIALAAQPTMENLIGGVILYADQVLRVGDFCQLGGISGTIETIGIRSTRIRALDRTLVTVANADLVKMQIVNFSRRDRSLLKTVIGLRYETTPDQLRYILRELRTLLTGHPAVLADTVRVRLVGLGDSALNVELFAHVATPVLAEFLEIQEGLLLTVVDIVTGAGSGFAYPSTTAYLGRDPGIDKDRQARAEREIAAATAAERPDAAGVEAAMAPAG